MIRWLSNIETFWNLLQNLEGNELVFSKSTDGRIRMEIRDSFYDVSESELISKEDLYPEITPFVLTFNDAIEKVNKKTSKY